MSPCAPGLGSLQESEESARQPGLLLGIWLQRQGPGSTERCYEDGAGQERTGREGWRRRGWRKEDRGRVRGRVGPRAETKT